MPVHAKPLNLSSPEAVAFALHQRPHFAWLDANAIPNNEGRWSYFASDPSEIVQATCGDSDPFAALNHIQEHPGFWIGYIAYDAAWTASSQLHSYHTRSRKDPVLCFARYPGVIGWDHQQGRGWCFGNMPSLNTTLSDLPLSAPQIGQVTVDSAQLHECAILEALDRIRAGDIYQVNLARRWQVSYQGDAFPLFLIMREQSPVPYGCYLQTPSCVVLSRSMECFLNWEGPGQKLYTQPIKGTVALNQDASIHVQNELRNDSKELAEHTMIVDLMRNDLSRISEPHSVRVLNPYAINLYAKLCHMVSTVECVTPSNITLEHVLRATFPPGSISGAPKHAAIQLIESLEPAARGIYTGAIGIVFPDGRAKFSVAIRTAVLREDILTYWAGGGIVAASQPEKELAETELKSKVFVDTLNRLRVGSFRNSLMQSYCSRQDRVTVEG